MDTPSAPYSPHEDFERRFVKPSAGRTLIVGSHVYPGRLDRRERYSVVEGWDIVPGPGVDRVIDLEEPLADDAGVFEHIECISVLEHSRRPWLLAANLERLAAGTIYVAAPFVHRLHNYPSDLWRFTVEGMKALFTRIEWSASCYAHEAMSNERKQPPTVKVNGYPYHARTDVLLFGRKV